MKKKLCLVLVCLLVVALFAGCGGGGGEKPKDSNAPAPAGKTTQLLLATGGTAGTYYPLGGAMAQIFNTKIANMNVTAQATGAAIENVRLINKKEADLAIVQSDIMDYAFKGAEVFKEKMPDIRAIAILYPEIIQVVVPGESDIKGIEDFKGKKISVGAPGSGNEANSRQIFEAYQMDYKMLTPNYLSYAESAERFKDKQIDAFLFTTGAPNSAIQEIATSQSIRMLAIPDDKIAAITQKYPFLAPATVPANTYKGQTADVKTVAVQAALIANKGISDEIVYNITKALFENQAALAQAHAKGKELSLEKAIKGISIPLHPGAEKYYKEKGLIK